MKTIFRLFCAVLMLLTLSAQAEELRVLLRSAGENDVLHVTLCGPYTAEEFPALRPDENARLTLSRRDGHILLRSGSLQIDAGERLTLARLSSDARFFLEESPAGNAYVGSLTVTADGGALCPVLTIGAEDYLCGVVGYEMSDSFPAEALKAQSVAARTYALRKQSRRQGTAYDLTDTPDDQVFRGFNPDQKNVHRAVKATEGLCLLRGERLAECLYTASNGGQTARPQDVWGGNASENLPQQDDPYDFENPRSLVNAVEFRSDLSDCAALKPLLQEQLCGTFADIRAIEPVRPDPADSRRFTALKFTVSTRSEDGECQTETAELSVFGAVKEALSLGLNRRGCELIRAERINGGFRLEMRRFGHGCGMSQRGAEWMAAKYGRTFEEILAFYYPETTLAPVPR